MGAFFFRVFGRPDRHLCATNGFLDGLLTDGAVNLTSLPLISMVAGSPVPLSVTSYSPTGPSQSSGNCTAIGTFLTGSEL